MAAGDRAGWQRAPVLAVHSQHLLTHQQSPLCQHRRFTERRRLAAFSKPGVCYRSGCHKQRCLKHPNKAVICRLGEQGRTHRGEENKTGRGAAASWARITASLSKMNSAFFRRSSAEIQSLHVLLLPAGTETTCALHRGGGTQGAEQNKSRSHFFFFFKYSCIELCVRSC